MKTVNVHEAKTQFSALLARVEKRREPILICRNGKPVADLVPHRPKNRLRVDPLLSQVVLKYDPVEPLAADEWAAEED